MEGVGFVNETLIYHMRLEKMPFLAQTAIVFPFQNGVYF